MRERPDGLAHDQMRARRPTTDKVLRRSRNRVVGGVAAGVAEYLKAKPTALRWVFGLVTVLSGGLFLLPYALLVVLLPAPTDLKDESYGRPEQVSDGT